MLKKSMPSISHNALRASWILLTLVACCLCTSTVSAALIQGTVYDFDLQKSKAIVKIDTVPVQTYVTEDGTYVFEVSEGNYTLNAKMRTGGQVIAEASENIIVADAGTYNVDLILFPILGDDIEDIDIDEELFPEEEESGTMVLLVILLLLLLAAVLIYVFRVSKLVKKDEKIADQLEADAEVLAYIERHKHLNQRELVKQFPMSEAKMSLILTALENKGKIKKIRKGRSNVIIKR